MRPFAPLSKPIFYLHTISSGIDHFTHNPNLVIYWVTKSKFLFLDDLLRIFGGERISYIKGNK